MGNYNLMWLSEKQNSNKKGAILYIFLITILYLFSSLKSNLLSLILFIPLTYGLLYLSDLYMKFFCETTEVILALPFTIEEIISNNSRLIYKKVWISTMISYFCVILFKILTLRRFASINKIDIIFALLIIIFLKVFIPFYGFFLFNYGIKKMKLINFIFIILILLSSIFISLKLNYMVLILYSVSSITMILYKRLFLKNLSKENIFKEV